MDRRDQHAVLFVDLVRDVAHGFGEVGRVRTLGTRQLEFLLRIEGEGKRLRVTVTAEDE